jgi:hypothetical protein
MYFMRFEVVRFEVTEDRDILGFRDVLFGHASRLVRS